MALSKRGWIRGVVMAVITVAAVILFALAPSSRTTVFPDIVELVEVLALIVPLLWINERRKWAAIAAAEFLIWFGFRSIQTWMKEEYLYALGFALCCLICTGIFLWRSRRERTAQLGS